MNKLCITLDDVLRAKTKQFGKIYKRAIDPDIDLDSLDLSTNNLATVFNMTAAEYNKFLYEDYAFEIFAEAPAAEKMLDKNLNLWHIRLNNGRDEDEHVELLLANAKEFNASIGFTYFFLSQMGTRIRETYFPTDSLKIWDKCDALITADPLLLNNKPEGKVSVKIKMPYNQDCEADYEYETLAEVLKDEDFIEKVFPRKKKENDDEEEK